MKIRKSEVFKSSSMYPAYWGECLKSARSQGFKYIDFNGMVFETNKDQSPEIKNSVCVREDLIDEDVRDDDVEKIIQLQFSVFAKTDTLLRSKGLRVDDEFKKRLFKNIEYLNDLKEWIIN